MATENCGWNRSNKPEGGAANAKSNGRRSLVRGIAVLAVVVLAAVVVSVFVFSGKEDAEVTKENNAGLIKEVAPAVVPKAEPEPPKPIDPNARPTKVGEVVNGYVMLPSGRIHRRVGVITNSVAMRPKPAYAIFKHKCNNEIACYLSLKPGDTLVGTRRYTGKFKDNFIKSISTPIVVTEDDTPEQAQLKRDVIAARLQLKDAMDRGEDIEQIMIDTRNELQDLMRVKNSMRKLFNEEVKKCETEQDVEDMIEASNKMLAEKGIAPLKCNAITKMNILRDIREQREEQGGTEE